MAMMDFTHLFQMSITLALACFVAHFFTVDPGDPWDRGWLSVAGFILSLIAISTWPEDWPW